ncbi:MAG: hypothetical protein R3277_08840 [Brumimicrobium sp.]|nr:hypothetical protein [Brumimicrobium sp.]
MKKILYILSGNLSTTPRALQSIKTAKQHYEVEVLGVNRSDVWAKIDTNLIDENSINYKTVSLKRDSFFTWLTSSIVHSISQKIYKFFSKNIHVTAYASSKTMYLLKKELKKYNKQYDLVIAHSYGSLYPAYIYSRRNNIPFIFDIEDFHPGEAISNNNQFEAERKEFLMKKLLSKASFITYASPLIGSYSLKLLDDYPDDRHSLINNCFSELDFSMIDKKSEKINFVWFSQNITAGRGLETIIPILYNSRKYIHLTLIGNLYSDFYTKFLKQYKDAITFISPLSQRELNERLADFDIGLALELKSSDANRDICLTNKIFAYAQAGLYVLATDTRAQTQFINEHSLLGALYTPNTQELKNRLEFIINSINEIRKDKQTRFDYAKRLSWENESLKLIEVWENLLQ